LVLTERTDHVHAIHAALASTVPSLFVLHGQMSKKQRAALVAELDALAPDASRVLVATGKLVGEGFDHPPLDTLVLAMPVSVIRRSRIWHARITRVGNWTRLAGRGVGQSWRFVTEYPRRQQRR
jgi:superfamily II DNA or RNA helicase